MTLTDELKIPDNKIKANQGEYDLSREAAKISALSSKDLLEKYEYLTGEDLGHRPSVLEKTKFEYSPLGMSLSKSFKKDNVKNIAKCKRDFDYGSNHEFYKFYKGYDEFEEMSLDSKYNRIKEFNKLLIKFKSPRHKKAETQLKKERIMENVDELYEKYYNVYKNDFDNDDELSEAKKKKFDYKQFELFNKTDKKLTLDGETKKDEESKLTELPKRLHSKNDFKRAKKLTEDIRADTNNVKSSSGDKKVFNNLDKLINDIKNKKTTRKNTIEKIKNIVSDLDQQRQKESTVFQNKMIDVVYYLFNSLGISSQPGRSRLSKWVKVSKEKFNEILSTITKAKNKELRTNIDGKEITLDSTEKLLKDLGNGILLDEREFKNRYNDIAYDAEVIVNKSPLTRNQAKIIDIILLLKKIWSDKQPNTTDISGLKSEESDEQNK